MKKWVGVFTLLIVSCSGLAVAQHFKKNQPIVPSNKNNMGQENRNFSRFLGESQNLKLDVNGSTRELIEYGISDSNGEKDYKKKDLMIIFHNDNETAERMKNQTIFVDLAKSNNLVLVFPEGLNHHWNDGRIGYDSNVDVDFVKAIVKKYKDLGVNKIMVSGFSNGAILSLRLACENIDGLDYFGAISGALPESYACKRSPGKHVMMINGTDDNFVKWEGGSINGGGNLLGIEKTLEIFEKSNQCVKGRVSTIDINFSDRSSVDKQTYSCKKGSLLFYKVEGGGHTMPGGKNRATLSNKIGNTNRDISSERELIDFMKK